MMISLVVLGALVFSLLAIGVRAQLAATRGFDLSMGAALLCAAECYVWISSIAGIGSLIGVVIAMVVCPILAILIMVLWNVTISWASTGAESGRPTSALVLIASMGFVTAVSGLVQVARGPGLLLPESLLPSLFIVGVPVRLFGIVALLAVVIVGLLAFARLRVGVALVCFSSSPGFAREIGISRHQVVLPASVVSGVASAFIGMHYAVLDGSRATLAHTPVLYGITGALLLPGRSLTAAAIGGAVLGAVFSWSELVVDSQTTQLGVFLLLAVLLLARRSGRETQAVR